MATGLITQAIPQEQTLKKKKWKKYLLIFMSAIFFLAVLFFTLPYIFSLFAKDIEFVDDQDLRLENIHLSESENAYYDLIEIQQPVLSQADAERLSNHESGKEWDIEFVARILPEFKEAFQHFDTAVKKSLFQDIGIDELSELTPKAVIMPLQPLHRMPRLSAVKSEYLLQTGNPEQALQEAMKPVRLAQKIQNSQATLIHFLVSFVMKESGLLQLQRIASSRDVLPKDLVAYAQELEKYRTDVEGFKRVFKLEYAYLAHSIDSMFRDDSLFTDPEEFLEVERERFVRIPFYFQPNRTKQYFADDARLHIVDAEALCSSFQNREFQEPIPPSAWKLYFTENAVGKILHNIAAVGLTASIQKKCEEEMLVSATQAVLALRAYEQEKGAFPDNLDELVHEYISVVPHDPFDNKSIKYSKEKKVLYSVGKDKINSGGSTGDDWRNMPDPTFSLD